MNRWLKILTQIDSIDEAVCPYCGSKNVGYKETLFKRNSTEGYADIWCRDCKSAYHISRGEFKDPAGREIVVPQGLDYK